MLLLPSASDSSLSPFSSKEEEGVLRENSATDEEVGEAEDDEGGEEE